MMKQFCCILLAGVLFASLVSCATKGNNPYSDKFPTEYFSTSCSKDSVDELMTIIGEIELGGLSTGISLDEEHCYNVTPPAVAAKTDIKIFKFSNSCITLALIDNEVYEICNSFGGHGFVDAVPWDYDEDGNFDLLIASSWGSGLHRSEISVFNTKTKESIIIYDTLNMDDPCVDLTVGAVYPSFSSIDPNDLSVVYQVFSVNVKVSDLSSAGLDYSLTDVIGSIVVKDGMPVFEPMEK